MGNFYTNFNFRTSEQTAVVERLRTLQRTAWVTPPLSGWVVVYDEICDQQDTEEIVRFGVSLSSALSVPILAFLNHDDDVLCYWLFDKGKLIDAYVSSSLFEDMGGEPTAASGNAEVLCKMVGSPDRQAEVAQILGEEDVTFEVERHARLVTVLGLTEAALLGYGYIEEGELPDGIDSAALVKVGGG